MAPAGACPACSEAVGCPLGGGVAVPVVPSATVWAGGFSGVEGCSVVAVCLGSGLGVLGSICIFSAIGCSRSGGG